MQKINRLLVANRGEIAIRVLRAASELRIRTIAIYTHEDRYSLHRHKADEAYMIGKPEEPLKPYLDMEAIIALAKRHQADAIHPGYGFLSENALFARRCREENILFVGPRPEVMEALGDKIAAKKIALKAGVPLIEDSHEDLVSDEIVESEALRIGLPIMLKAAAGGGGRGMRVVREASELLNSFHEARSEAGKAFGNDTIFMEKYIDDPKHIEVQILGDNEGNLVHLFERDCSVQRRFQKVVEVAPAPTLTQATKDKLYEYALSITREVNYNNAGTVEFLVDKDENVYFIEVNPRIQVEHTITEEITGVDIVRSQILIASGSKLSDRGIYILSQESVKCNGFALQCRITTEDPANGFKPDYGTIIAYRNAAGFGIRLDEGSSYPGMKISPFFDSLLVKVSARGRTLRGACQRLDRALREFRIRGVKTNIAFLLNVINDPVFQKGEATVRFIENNPALLKTESGMDRATKILRYLANVIVNGHPDLKNQPEIKTKVTTGRQHILSLVPDFQPYTPYPKGNKDRLGELGREKFVQWLKAEKAIHYTDTTFRDAHQSLLATRVRTIDMLRVAESFARNHPQVFSMEVWGGATFDVAMRFLQEDPWQRLRQFRQAMPNMLLQMLIRGTNAVGYSAYPANLVEKFIEKSWENGVDIFRIFDSLNDPKAMQTAIRAVVDGTGALAEASICYTGDLLNPENRKYTLNYYLDLAKRLEDTGTHLLCIKDMAGLLKPYAAKVLIERLKETVSLPIHLHTHDTASVQTATYLKAIEAGVDVVDVAIGAMSGLTSQPNFNSLVAIMQFQEREQTLDWHKLNRFSSYWEEVRSLYLPFESDLKSGAAEVYENEIPGGQYSNLRSQAEALGVGDRFDRLKQNYVVVNRLFGDIVKVTPSSKIVGDMAIFMTSNNLTADDILERGQTLSFPESVVNFFKGEIGVPYGGFPEALQKIILKGEKPLPGRPEDSLEPLNIDTDFQDFTQRFPENTGITDYLSYKMYPKVYAGFYQHQQEYADISRLPTPAFFYGLQPEEEIIVDFEDGKSLIIRLLYVQEPNAYGIRKVTFELNGQARILEIKDQSFRSTKTLNAKVASRNEIGSPLPGKLANILVREGDTVQENTPLFVIEAMKMETAVKAPFAGKVEKILLAAGSLVEQEDAVVVVG
jgi:pyruvate carboxylase